MEEVVKDLIQATVAQLQASVEANHWHEEFQAHQKQTMALLIQAQKSQAVQLEAQMKSVQTQLTALADHLNMVVAPSKPVMMKASNFLQKLASHDDVKTFLTTFECMTNREGWEYVNTSGQKNKKKNF